MLLGNFHNGRPRILPVEYATFRPDILDYFYKDVLPGMKAIFDPMCGTAPLIPYSEKHGLIAYFNDVLPVHYYINQTKTYSMYAALRKKEKHDKNYLSKELYHCMKSLKGKKLLISDKWIHGDILEGLKKSWSAADEHELPLKSLIKALILLCVRPYSSITLSEKNRTWFKMGGISTEKTLLTIIREKIELLSLFYQVHYQETHLKSKGWCHFSMEDATLLDLPNHVDGIITSPPYCNRLDNERIYAPELYFLKSVGYSNSANGILGTNMVQDYVSLREDLNFINRVAPKTREFLQKVANKKEEDKAYYLKYFARYYAKLYRILENCSTLIRKGTKMFIVVQNNIHRGELNEMDEFVKDFFSIRGFRVDASFRELRIHQGRRNISEHHPVVIKKHYETVLKVKPC